MTIETGQPFFPVNPRPGVVKALGVAHLVMAISVSLCVTVSTGWFLAAAVMSPPSIQVEQVTTQPAPAVVPPPGAAATPKTSIASTTITMNPMMGLDQPIVSRFFVIDLITALVVNLVMFVAGIGLINLKPWARPWSNWVAWIKIVRLVVLWGGFLVLVAPTLSESMATNVLKMIPPNARGQGPNQAILRQAYLIMSMIISGVMIVVGVVYPAVSLWVASRPGFRAALLTQAKPSMMEWKQP